MSATIRTVILQNLRSVPVVPRRPDGKVSFVRRFVTHSGSNLRPCHFQIAFHAIIALSCPCVACVFDGASHLLRSLAAHISGARYCSSLLFHFPADGFTFILIEFLLCPTHSRCHANIQTRKSQACSRPSDRVRGLFRNQFRPPNRAHQASVSCLDCLKCYVLTILR